MWVMLHFTVSILKKDTENGMNIYAKSDKCSDIKIYNDCHYIGGRENGFIISFKNGKLRKMRKVTGKK
jgi:hypothetical protein